MGDDASAAAAAAAADAFAASERHALYQAARMPASYPGVWGGTVAAEAVATFDSQPVHEWLPAALTKRWARCGSHAKSLRMLGAACLGMYERVVVGASVATLFAAPSPDEGRGCYRSYAAAAACA